MKLTWYGHACFLLENAEGVRILTDPCDGGTGYRIENVAADIVTTSHDHFDHNHVSSAAGSPCIIKEPGAQTAAGVPVTGFSTYHDDAGGSLRGKNVMFLFELDGLRVLHAGDLGHVLDEKTCAAIGPVDVLLCPVGGKFTVDAAGAKQVTEQLSPSLVVPMHYQTPALSFELADVAPFLSLFPERLLHRIAGCTVEITQEMPARPGILLPTYA